LAETGTVRPILAYWLPNLAMILIALIFVFKKGQEVNFLIVNRIIMLYFDVKRRVQGSGKPSRR
jgi:hypothetical protein